MSNRLGVNHLLTSTLAKRKTAKNPLQAGFTLVELLVVVIIVAILASVALPAFLNQANKAKVASAKALASAGAKECQVWLIEGDEVNGAFVQSTQGGSGVTINEPGCTAAAGGTFTATIASPSGTYSAAVDSSGAIEKTCADFGCNGGTW